jgi:MFS family permease
LGIRVIARFCGYAVLRNLRFHEPFLLLFLTESVGLSLAAAGAVLAFEKLLTGALEIPLSVVNDRFGRRRTLAGSFLMAAVAFAAMGYAASAPDRWRLGLLYVSQAIFSVAEALRTGTHKAIILDWLEGEGRSDEATRVIGVTRFYSKTSEGFAALAAGVVVWLTGAYTWLFWLAIVPAAANWALLLSYPKSLEGEIIREIRRRGHAEPWAHRLRKLLSHPGVAVLVVLSMLFESQIELALQYLQPYLAATLRGVQLQVAGGVGALFFGAWYFLCGLLAGGSALLSTRLVRWSGGVGPALSVAYLVATAATLVGGLAAFGRASWPALLCLMLLAALQNARRPVFVAALEERMDKKFRTTTLSIENQGRAWIYAASAVCVGAVGDAAGLAAAFAVMAGVLLAGGAAVRVFGRPRATQPAST